MKIRGERECQDCGTRWAYYETGSVECPSCGSLRSVGVEDERTLHTASSVSLDLTPARELLDEGKSLRQVAETAGELTREFTRGYGFVDGGDFRPLDDRYLSAMELRHVAGDLSRTASVDEAEEFYLLTLLRGDLGDRPAPDEVPDSLRAARGLAYANAVKAYRSDLRTYLDEHPDPLVGDVLGPLGEHVKRARALDGDVPPDEVETLVTVARNVGRYLIEDDETALLEAENALESLG